ncbi:MAG: hypothetical protein GQ570_11690 [Helicobacteraceae bacterium]|nr:hypothetical protein [Helicobacteraceae bacterium]
MPKIKHFEATEETHKMAKASAFRIGYSLKDYVRLCVVSCESDAGKKQTASTSTHNDLMNLFDMPIESTTDDLIGTAWLEIYNYTMNLKA